MERIEVFSACQTIKEVIIESRPGKLLGVKRYLYWRCSRRSLLPHTAVPVSDRRTDSNPVAGMKTQRRTLPCNPDSGHEQTATNKPVLLRYRSGLQHMPFTDVQSTSTRAAVAAICKPLMAA